MQELLLVQVGNGDKQHLGVQVVRNGVAVNVSVGCGSRRVGTGKRVLGVANVQTYLENPRHCEKCAVRWEVVAA